MPKNKSHKGLLKRVKVTRNGKIKLQRAFGRHLRSHKPGQTIRKYRLSKYASDADMPRLRSLLGLPIAKKRRTETAAAETTPDKDAAKPAGRKKKTKKKVTKTAEAAKD